MIFRIRFASSMSSRTLSSSKLSILTQNRENVLHVMDTYIEKMQGFREAIDNFDEDKVRSFIEEANRIKKIIR